ncbi:CoA transferase [Xanthobacter oligotrophicus]|uniref:CoA transferase n=1 Tax=Xanthobacter oligotrophicus TaxID=2607286 RepID=A0ABW6ZZV0_9HYPH
MLENTLEGVRVLDITQNVAGPFCTQILGDLGAEVIKLERPGRGDDTRDWRPPEIGGQSSTFLALNRNKSSICVDIAAPQGIEIFRDLAAQVDVVVHSMKPGSAEHRGVGYADLRPLNPGLVYCAISAFGQDGPLSALPGYDPLMQAFTGIMSTTGNEGDDPVRVGVSLIDMGTGMWAALGILSALMQRARTGAGTLVEASLMDTGINWMAVFIASFRATGNLPRKLGSAMAMTAPYELFPAADGHVFIAAGNDGLFARVCTGLGAPDLACDPRFATNPKRVENRVALRESLGAYTRARPAAEIVAGLRRAGAPCSELNTVADVLDHPQVRAAGIIASLPVAQAPDHQVVALPFKAGGRRSARYSPPPALGADTARVLSDLGYGAADVAAWRAAGIVA